MNQSKKIIALIIGIVVVGFVGVYAIILVNEGTSTIPNPDWDEVRESITKQCEPTYLEEGFDSVEDCVIYEMARFGQEIKQNCMTGLEYLEYVDKYSNECPVNFEELGFESSIKCHQQTIGLFDPLMCS